MLTDHTLNKWAELLDERSFWEGPTTLERYELAELHSMARELIEVRRNAATVIEQQAEIERLREALRLIVEEEPTSDIWVGHYGIRAIKLHAKDALGATQ